MERREGEGGRASGGEDEEGGGGGGKGESAAKSQELGKIKDGTILQVWKVGRRRWRGRRRQAGPGECRERRVHLTGMKLILWAKLDKHIL